MVFGDSFTSNPDYGGVTWADYFPIECEQNGFDHVSLKNYGRDGYGTVQMIEFAAHKIKKEKPDIVIIAFIYRDLFRKRTWRMPIEDKGSSRVLSGLNKDVKKDFHLKRTRDVTLLDKSITENWAENSINAQITEAKLTQIINRYHRLGLNRKLALRSLSHSLLFNRVFFKNPFYSWITMDYTNLRLMETPEIYKVDHQFKSAVQEIKKSKVPIIFVRLPVYEELLNKKYEKGTKLNEFMEEFSKTVKYLSPFPIIELIHEIDPETKESKEWFMFQYGDGHPSQKGSKAYAKAITQKLIHYKVLEKPNYN